MVERGEVDGGTSRFLGPIAVIVVAAGGVMASTGPAWTATHWTPVLTPGSAGEAKAQTTPARPTGVSAACTSASAQTVKVSWTAVSRATGYTIYEATTSATGTYTSVASGVTASPWTSGTLSAGNYWFEVMAQIGSNWVGTKSTASSESTTSSGACTQP